MSKEASKARVKAAKKQPQTLAKQARAQATKMPTRALQQQASALLSPLTRQEEAILEYAHTLTNPWVEEPSGVPLILGSGTVRTNKCQVIYEGTATANSSGFAFAAMAMDGWYTSSADPDAQLPAQYTSYSGGTQGFPIWYTGGTYNGNGGVNPTKLPAASDTTAVTGLNSIAAKLLDGTVNSQTGVRQVAAGLRVFSDAAAQSAQGKLAIVAFSEPTATAANGGSPLTDYATTSGMPQDLVSFQSKPCAGWRSGEVLHAVAVPTSTPAFQFLKPPATGATTFGYPQLCAMLTGGASGQTFTFQIVYDYEFTFSMTNLTGVSDDPVYSVGVGAVTNVHNNIAAQGVTTAGPLTLTSGKGPKGIKAALQHVHDTMPGRAPQILQLATRPAQSGIMNWVNNNGSVISKVAQGALGLVSNFAPGWLGKAAKGVLNFLTA